MNRKISLLMVVSSVISSSSIVLSKTTCASSTSTSTDNIWKVQKIDTNDKNIKIPVNSKKIHFVRHAQGYHNVAGETDPIFGYLREDLEDAILTDLGKKQCEDLSNSINDDVFKNINLIFVSPMRRTIQTSLLSFPNQAKNSKVIFLANENIREQTGMHPCDRRRTIDLQRKDYPRIDFSKIISDKDPIYSSYTFREPETHCAARGKEFLEYLFTLDEKEVIVVTHSGWLKCLFKYILKTEKPKEDGRFNNCQMKSFIITSEKKIE